MADSDSRQESRVLPEGNRAIRRRIYLNRSVTAATAVAYFILD